MNRTRLLLLIGTLVGLAFLTWWCSPPDVTAPTDPEADRTRVVPDIRIAVVPTVDDRYMEGPCCLVPSGGLVALPYLMRHAVGGQIRTVPVFLGDMTHTPGELGGRIALLMYREVIAQSKIRVVAAGPAELGLGVDFVRDVLLRVAPRETCAFLCANARDARGAPLLDAYALTMTSGEEPDSGHVTLFVSVLAASAAERLGRSGSDVELVDPATAAATALRDGRTKAESLGRDVDTAVLLVHGSPQEAADIARRAPGFRVAVASGTGMLPLVQPYVIGAEGDETTIASPGRGMRHGVFIEVPGEPARLPHVESIRIGVALVAGTETTELDPVLNMLTRNELPALFGRVVESGRAPHPDGAYVGAKKCAECHPEIVNQHATAPHARLSLAIRSESMAANPSCLGCHATAPFHDGGYRGPDDFTDFAGVSCEACHGPGGGHVEAPEAGWGMQDLMRRCYDCHLPERSPGFDAEKAWKELGHGGR